MTIRRELIYPSVFDLLNGLQENQAIHRYCSFAELYKMVQRKESSLSLRCPFAWDDLFENPLMRANLTIDKEKIDVEGEGRKLFCQCWTLNGESDAMWKMYGNQGQGVRISTTVKDLYFQAYNSFDPERKEWVFTKIGKIRYLDEEELKGLFTRNDDFVKIFCAPNCEGYYQSLLYKRKAYLTENEVRLIALDFDSRFSCPHTLRLLLPTQDHSWIKSVTLGPSIDSDTKQAHRDHLLSLGLPEEKIKDSDIYGPLKYSISL